MCFLVSSTPECSLKVRQGYTLIVACAGVGNVGQLCMDVLISSIESVFAGYLDSAHVPPVVGPPPYPELPSTAPLACSLEVFFSCICYNSSGNRTSRYYYFLPYYSSVFQLYDDDFRKLSLLQVRAPVFPGAHDRFATEIVDFTMQQKFSRVILLSSSFAMTRKVDCLNFGHFPVFLLQNPRNRFVGFFSTRISTFASYTRYVSFIRWSYV